MDTKVVCRAAYEKSTQALLSRLDPQLRFLLAKAYRLTGDFAAAEGLLRGLLEEFPESLGFHQELLHTLFHFNPDTLDRSFDPLARHNIMNCRIYKNLILNSKNLQ